VKELDSGDFYIDMVYLPKQRVSPVTTVLSPEGQSNIQLEFKRKFGFMKSIELGDALKFWGHSHVNFSVQPSGTDDQTMLTKGADGVDWFIRGIFNKQGRAKFDVYRFDQCYRVVDVPWRVADENGEILLTVYSPHSQNDIGPASDVVAEAEAEANQTTMLLYDSPEALRPSEELRLEVTHEFAEKVSHF
jgi:hypothetical protein